jgi:plasmid stabilization system protein ParE
MRYNHIYEPKALQEYEEAILWYNERSYIASQNFVLAVNEKLLEICLYPTRCRITKRHFRESLVQKYPFSIIYFIDEARHTVVVTSVFHNSRDPNNKYAA